MKAILGRPTENAVLLTLLLATLSACGGEAYREPDVDSDDDGSTAQSSSSSSPAASSSSGTVDTSDPENPVYTYSFSLTGSGGTAPTYTSTSISTDNTLRVRVIPGQAGSLSTSEGTDSNFSATYYCASYTVTVLGHSLTTQPLKINGGGAICANAAESEILDFSDRMTSGHGDVTVGISAPRYDYYCQLLYNGYINWGYYSTYCSQSLYPVYKNHTVTGSIEVEVNGTSL